MEETHELIEALTALPFDEVDYGAYADVEEELGDVLLQVLFHAAIASETGAFDISDVAEQLRRKLVRRHPHVFADVEANDAETVKANWDLIKADEKGGAPAADSVIGGVPTSLPGLARAFEVQRKAATVGFDWPSVEPVMDKLDEEAARAQGCAGRCRPCTPRAGRCVVHHRQRRPAPRPRRRGCGQTSPCSVSSPASERWRRWVRWKT